MRDPVGEAAAQDGFYRSQEARYKGLAGEKTMVDKVLPTLTPCVTSCCVLEARQLERASVVTAWHLFGWLPPEVPGRHKHALKKL